jgi:3-hydroxyacyl-[acyl-carrier-protein] dehydratase
LIDKLVECVPGKRAVAVKTFPRSEVLFMDHFAGLPTVPGVLQIEMVLQTAAKAIKLERPSVLSLLGVVRCAKFFRRIEPGDHCRITAEIVRMRERYALQTGIIEVDGVRVARVDVMVALVPSTARAVEDPLIEEWRSREAGRVEHDPLEASAGPVVR